VSVTGADSYAVKSDSDAGNSGLVSGALLNGASLLTWLYVTTAHKQEAITIATMVKYVEAQ